MVEEVRKIAPDGVHTIVEVSAARNAAADVQLLRPAARSACTPTTAATR